MSSRGLCLTSLMLCWDNPGVNFRFVWLINFNNLGSIKKIILKPIKVFTPNIIGVHFFSKRTPCPMVSKAIDRSRNHVFNHFPTVYFLSDVVKMKSCCHLGRVILPKLELEFSQKFFVLRSFWLIAFSRILENTGRIEIGQ